MCNLTMNRRVGVNKFLSFFTPFVCFGRGISSTRSTSLRQPHTTNSCFLMTKSIGNFEKRLPVVRIVIGGWHELVYGNTILNVVFKSK